MHVNRIRFRDEKILRILCNSNRLKITLLVLMKKHLKFSKFKKIPLKLPYLDTPDNAFMNYRHHHHYYRRRLA